MKLTKIRNILIAVVAVLAIVAVSIVVVQRKPDMFAGNTQAVRPSDNSTDTQNPGQAEELPAGVSDFGALLKLNKPEAEVLPYQHNVRRWPAENMLTADLTGGAPKLADFKGRPKDQKALAGALVFLDYGHGGIDGGTVYPRSAPHEFVEKELNIEIGRKLKSELEELGATVVEIREQDEWISIYARAAAIAEHTVKMAAENTTPDSPVGLALASYQPHFEKIYELNKDKAGGDILGGTGQSRQVRFLYDLQRQYENCIVISLHCNYSEQTSEARGMQVYYLDNEYVYNYFDKHEGRGYVDDLYRDIYPIYQNYDDEGRSRLANLTYKTVTTALPQLTAKNAGSVLTYNFAVLRCTGFNSILVEMGFLSNADDRAFLSSETGQNQIATALADSVYNYYCTE